MQEPELQHAIAAARMTASALDLTVDDVFILQNSNRLMLRLLPCDIVVRVAPSSLRSSAEFEVEVAQRLAATGSPVALLDPRVEPRVYVRDGFAMNLWTYYDEASRGQLLPADHAHALKRLHAGMRNVAIAAPHFLDRVAQAEGLIANADRTPALDRAGRELLLDTFTSVRQEIARRGPEEQLLHGEPHPGNVLNTAFGPVFIDLETCCRGPVEFDLAHLPTEACQHYSGIDQVLLSVCRRLVLAMVASWRWDVDDQFPDGLRHGRAILDLLRSGPPWPTIDELSTL